MKDLSIERINYGGKSGLISAYMARPQSGGPWPAVVLIRALFSPVEYIEGIARRIAQEGYLAFAGNHYANDPVATTVDFKDINAGVPIALAADVAAALAAVPPERRPLMERIVEWWNTRNETYVPDLLAGVVYLKAREDVRPEAMAVVGYGGGGLLTGHLAVTGADVVAAVIYSGHPPPVEQLSNVRCAVIGHYGKEDRLSAEIPAFAEAMGAHGKRFTPYIYDGAGHLFFDETHSDYNPPAAELAWTRTLAFFRASFAER